jgi:hypothetical protein
MPEEIEKTEMFFSLSLNFIGIENACGEFLRISHQGVGIAQVGSAVSRFNLRMR